MAPSQKRRPIPRLLLLFGAAAVALGGCDLFGTCSFDTVRTRDQGVEATAVAALPDTVVVAVVETPLFPFYGAPPVHQDPRRTVGADSVRVRGVLTTRETAPDLALRLAVRGDTVFVSFDAPLVRPACSPSLSPGEGFLDLDLPRGVVVRAVVAVPQGPAPASTAPFPVSRPILRA